jgi:hypothetical protein
MLEREKNIETYFGEARAGGSGVYPVYCTGDVEFLGSVTIV